MRLSLLRHRKHKMHILHTKLNPYKTESKIEIIPNLKIIINIPISQQIRIL